MNNVRFSKWLWLSFVVASAISVPFLFNACDGGLMGLGEGFKASRVCVSGAGQLAPGQVRKLNLESGEGPLSSVFKSRKLIVGRSEEGSRAFSQNSKATSASTSLSPGDELALLVNTACVQSRMASSENNELSVELARAQGVFSELSVQSYTHTVTGRPEDIESRIESDPCIEGATKNRVYTVSSIMATYNDPLVLYQSHLATLRADLAYPQFYHSDYGIPKQETGQEIRIAVIDTGVSYTHKDIENGIWRHGPNKNLWGINAVTIGTGNVDYNPSDVSPIGHGTHVTGIIGATGNNSQGIAGIVSYGAKVMAVKVFYDNGQGSIITTTSVLSRGVIWALDNQADVINMSLGRLVDGTQEPVDDPIYQELIVRSINAGAVVVSATGNATQDVPAQALTDNNFTVIPARYGQLYPGMINVGAVTVDNQGTVLGRSSFSHYSNKYVEIAAPGLIESTQGIYSTLPASGASVDGSYGYLPGTSQAAPMVSAAAALAMALYKTHFGGKPSPATVERWILSSARKDAGLTSQFKDGNILDLKGLVDTIQNEYPETKGEQSRSLSSNVCD